MNCEEKIQSIVTVVSSMGFLCIKHENFLLVGIGLTEHEIWEAAENLQALISAARIRTSDK